MSKIWLLGFALLVSVSGAKAAYWQGQTYAVPATPQITCNIGTGVASVGGPCTSPVAACNGDVQTLTRTVTISTGVGGFKYLSTSVPTFNIATDAGKLIRVPGSTLPNTYSVITSVTDSQNVVLTSAAASGFGPSSVALTFGTDDAPAFKNYNVWARANQGSTNQVVLTIPNGASCWFGSKQTITGYNQNSYFAGINNQIVDGGSGATLNGGNGNGEGYFLGTDGVCHKAITDAAGCSARIKTVSAGASTIELTATSYAAGYISRYTVGDWILVGGLDTQSLWNVGYGYPPNPTYFDWRQITSICNNTGPCTGTATITLDRPLTYALLDTWPLYSAGTAFEADQGGPATIWKMQDGWNSTAEFRNLTTNELNNINTVRRYVTVRNITTSGTGGMIPSQTEDWKAYNSTFLDMEVDKIVGNFLLDGVTSSIVKCQSNSVINTIVRNSTFTNQFTGCGAYTELTDVSMPSVTNGLYPGTYAYGSSTTFKCTRCDATIFNYAGGINQSARQSDYSMSGGVISFPNTGASGSDNDQRIFSPLPSNVFYIVGGSFAGTVGLVRPQSITQDATNTYVQTNEAGGFPAWSGGITGMRTHPAPQFTCDACTGDPVMVAMNIQTGATPLKPLGEFSTRTFTPSATGAQGKLVAMGKIVSLTVDVTVAGATASGNLALNPTAQFVQDTVKQSDWTSYNWLPVINLKTTGARVYTNSGGGTGSWTCNGVAGGCSGDTVTGAGLPPEQVWIKDSLTPYVAAGGTVTVTPTVKITVQTDQGVVP